MNWQQTFDPFVCSCGGTLQLLLLLLLLDLIVVGLKQETGKPSLWYWPSFVSDLKKSSLLCCCVLLCTVNGDQWLLSPHLYEEMVLLLACKKQGKHLKSQNSVQIWDCVDFEELEFLNFKFLIYFVHLTCLALVLILIWRKFEIALHLAHNLFTKLKRKSNS